MRGGRRATEGADGISAMKESHPEKL